MRDLGRAVVSGVTGFVGAALAGRLIQCGSEVFGLIRPGSRRNRISTLPGLRLIEWDGVSHEELRDRLQLCGPEVVFHLAAYGVQPGATDLDELLRGNIDYTLNLLRATADLPGCRFVHTGSCFEYGPAQSGRLLTEEAPTNPFSPYGATKLASVHLVRTVARRLRVPAVVLRLFTVYGPGEGEDRLVPSLVRSLTQGRPLDLTAGEQARDWLFIDDAVDAYCLAAQIGLDTTGENIYNACSAVPVTVRQVGETLSRLLGVPGELLRWGQRAYRPDEPMWIVGDNQRFRAASGWQPRFSIEQGLAATAVPLRRTGTD